MMKLYILFRLEEEVLRKYNRKLLDLTKLQGKMSIIDMKKKIEYIEILLNKREPVYFNSHHNLYIHSILNTIGINELLEFYLPLSDSDLKRSIESNLYRKIEYHNQPEKLFKELISIAIEANYKTRQRIRKLLLKLLERLENDHKYSFFKIFYHSQYINDIYAALSISKDIWNSTFDNLVLNDYLQNKDEYFLEIFLSNGNIETSLPYLEQIWSNQPSNFLKQQILKNICNKHINSIEFLRNVEPEKYLFALSISNNKIDEATLADCYNNTPEDLKPFALLSIGRMNKWKFIERELKVYINQ